MTFTLTDSPGTISQRSLAFGASTPWNKVESGPWHAGGQGLHEFERRHDDVGGPVLVGAFELEYDIAGAVEFEPFMGDGRAGDRQFIALIHGTAHLGVEAEPLGVGTALLGRLPIKARDGLQSQHLLTGAWSECNALRAGRRLQRGHGIIGIRFGHVGHPLLFNQIAFACQ